MTTERWTVSKERAAQLESIDTKIALCQVMAREYEGKAMREGAQLECLESLRDAVMSRRGNGDGDV
jgi:hypothetical protein